MDEDKAIRAAKLTLGGMLEKRRAKEAKERAPGQIAPSKYLPGVPRAVHADGGRVLPDGYTIHVDKNRFGVLGKYKGRNVAQLTLRRDRDTGDMSAFQMAVHPDHQRKGLMSAMHDAAEREFGPMKPDETLTDEGFDFWRGYRPDAVSNRLRFYRENLMGKPIQTSYGPGTVKSVGDRGMTAELDGRDGTTAWARARNVPDMLRENGIDPDKITYADGGEVADLGQAREQKQLRTFHSGMMDDIQTRMNHAMEAHQKAVDAGVFDGYEIGDVLQGSAHPMRITAKFMRKWKPTPMTLQGFDRMGAKPTIIEHEGKQYIPMLRYQTGVEGQDGFQEGDAYLDRVKAAGYKKMGGLRAVKADGGSVSDPRAAFLAGNHPAVPDAVYHGAAPKIATKGWTSEVDEEQTQKNRDAMDFREFKPSSYGNYGPGIYLTDKPDTASQYAMGVRADQKEPQPYGQVMKLHVSMKQPFTDSALKHPAWRDYIKEEIKNSLWLGGIGAGDRAAADGLVKKLDDGTATVRDLFLTDTENGTMVNQFGHDRIHKTICNSGFDGIIAHRPDGSKEIVAFKPEQVKSAISARKFDPTSPDMTFAAGGAAMFEGIHEDLQDEQGNPMELWHGTPGEGFDQFKDDKLGKRDTGFYGRGHYLTPMMGVAEGYADPEEMGRGTVMGPLHAALKNPFVWDMSDDNKAYRTKKDLETMGIKREGKLDPWDNLKSHEIDTFMKHMGQRGHDGVIVKQPNWQDGEGSSVSEVVVFNPNAIKHRDAEVFDPNDPRIMRASGGRTLTKHGLYSKAAEIIRSLPQEKGTVDQYIAAAKARGAKPAELEHAGRPEGDKITREEMAKHFDSRLPRLKIDQYGENPQYLSRSENRERMELQNRAHDFRQSNPLSDEESARLRSLTHRIFSGPNIETHEDEDTGEESPRPTLYEDYALPGGTDYRERLLRLPAKGGRDDYQSSHWAGHPNVLAHIRLQDRMVGEDRETVRPIAQKLADHIGVGIRDLSSGAALTGIKNGIITPEEGASVSRIMRWYNGLQDKKGIGSRVLHVEELQSDWAQEGRDQGFHDPKNPYEVVNKATNEVVSRHPDYATMWDAYRNHPNSDDLTYGYSGNDKPPAAPYVQNTQHWTDLALKNVLQEAAAGNYDHVVFSPGQAQADRYGLEKQVDNLSYHPSTKTLMAMKGNRVVFSKDGMEPEEVASHVGRDVSQRLMHPDAMQKFDDGDSFYNISGDDLKMGGEGMKGYYDNIVPKSVMRLAQQHDPDIKPGSMELPQGYTGFSIPMTDKLKQGVLAGQPAFKRGGSVDVEKALAVTRSFTKDGRAAMMRLKD